VFDKDNSAEILEALREQTKWTASLQAGLSQFMNGNRVTGHRPITRLPSSTGGALAVNGSGRLVGWSLAVDGGEPVRLLVRDGREPGQGDVLAVIDVGAAAVTGSIGLPGVTFGEALYVERTGGAGQLIGSLFLGAVD